MLTNNELLNFLEEKTDQYNRKSFIESDPVSIPHLFSNRSDIEISGFLVAAFSWGQRKTICRNGNELMRRMDFAPYEFVMNASAQDYNALDGFVHRTFNSSDLITFMKALKTIFAEYGNIENAFIPYDENDHGRVKDGIIAFRKRFFMAEHLPRTEKHISDPMKKASCKRLNMFLRWMVRNDGRGVDFGLWKAFSPSALLCPLDVHSGRVATKLGLLIRKTNDWKAVEELTGNLKKFDPVDPVKYDFALFGLGVFEKF